MEERLVTSDHIQKLGHPILEIRQRALSNIIRKLAGGYRFDNEVARTRELLDKLLAWFLFEPCTDQDKVIDLLRQTLQSNSGQLVLSHCGKSFIKSKLEGIGCFIEPNNANVLEDLIKLVDSCESSKIEIPPLCSDIPLSYRSNASDYPPYLGSTATTMAGYLEKDASLEQQFGNVKPAKTPNLKTSEFTKTLTDTSINSESTDEVRENDDFSLNQSPTCSEFLKLTLPWQPLIETDRNVLMSVEKPFLSPSKPKALYHTCEFFTNILLHDFPAEVFLQRPNIVLVLNKLLGSCSSKKLSCAILNCLLELTKALQIRVNYWNDPNMQHIKIVTESPNVFFSSRPQEGSDSPSLIEAAEEIRSLKEKQLSITEFCFRTMRLVLKCLTDKEETESSFGPRFNATGINTSLILLNELSDLVFMVITQDIWHAPNDPRVIRILRDVNEILTCYGDALEYFRIESISLETDSSVRVTFLCLLHLVARFLQKLIPVSKSRLILPKNFKIAVADSLLDVSLSKLYPQISKGLLNYIENFNDSRDHDILYKYKKVSMVCNSLKAAVRFFKENTSLGFKQCLNLAEIALPSLEFHKNLRFVQIFIDLCSDKMYDFRDNMAIREKVEDFSGSGVACDNFFAINIGNQAVLTRLLAHSLDLIQNKSYQSCHRKVLDNIGINARSGGDRNNGAHIFFLLSARVFKEIILFGLKNEKVNKYAEDILLSVLKCKHLVSQDLWNNCLETLMSVMSYLFCFADNTTILGRNIIGLADPDTAQALEFPKIVMFRANVQLLFVRDAYIREEAFSRVCWLIAGQDSSKEYLPKMMTVFDKTLANSCEIQKIVDINKIRQCDHFYQPSSLIQVLDLLKSPEVEPVIRRSALNQISVILDDSLLHEVFFEHGGIDLMLEIMKSALTEKNYKDYPDAIVPVVSILKNIVLYNPVFREELSRNEDILYFTLRGLFLFFTDDKMRQDCATLLFLLIFKDCMSGTPSRGDVALLVLLKDVVNVPFVAHFNGDVSAFTEVSLLDEMVKDQWCLTSLQMQWNSEVYGGFEALIKFQCNSINIESDEILHLRQRDIEMLKSSCTHYSVEKILQAVENGTSYTTVIEAVTELTRYLILNEVSFYSLNNKNQESFLTHDWEKTFSRFLKKLPSSKEDVLFLKHLLQFLILMTPLFKTKENYWLKSLLKDPNSVLLDVLYTDSSVEDEIKSLSQDLVKLITLCVVQEHNYLDYYSCRTTEAVPKDNWGHLIKVLNDNLKLSDSEHFYYLAYLDIQLTCLVHLTAISGWSKSRSIATSKDSVTNLISGLCKLISAFHCGKGPSAAVSVMGLSITKNVLLILNNIFIEKQQFRIRSWELCFFEYAEESNLLPTFLNLWLSRDTIIRAASLKLFSILASTPEGIVKIIDGLKQDAITLLDIVCDIVIDCKEAPIVRENAVILLGNILKNYFASSSLNALKTAMANLFRNHDFYNNLQGIFSSLFTIKVSTRYQNTECYTSESNSNSTDSTTDQVLSVTPGLLRAVCKLLLYLESVFPNTIGMELEARGLVKLIFRTICNPAMEIKNTKELVLYSDILEMDINVLQLLKKMTLHNDSILGTILHTQDCLNALFALFDHEIYHTHLVQLACLKNNLWTELLTLISALSGCDRDHKDLSICLDAQAILINTIAFVGTDCFFGALFEALGSIGIPDVQHAALSALLSILKPACYVVQNPNLVNNKNEEAAAIVCWLDTVQSPRTVTMFTDDAKENFNYQRINNKNKLNTETNLLEETYFGKTINAMKSTDLEVSVTENKNNALMIGAEICKILLYLYDIASVEHNASNRSITVAALSSVLCVSKEAKNYANKTGLMSIITKELRDIHIKLSLESVESLKRIQEKKRICPMLQHVDELIGLLTNLMLHNDQVKLFAIKFILADLLHKLWIWISFQNVYVNDVLKLLVVFTLDCSEACQSLTLTSAVAGSGPKKSSTTSLLHVIIATIGKELDQISKTHDLSTLEMAFQILRNCLISFDCRMLILKSNLFQLTCKLHPSITRKLSPWDTVEALWLQFLHDFTTHPEGQSAVAKSNEILELTFSMTAGTKLSNKILAMEVIRNLAFYQPNRARLLASESFLNILHLKLMTGAKKEKQTSIVTIWALAANNQKAKLIFKAAQFDVKLESLLKQSQVLKDQTNSLDREDINRIQMVLDMIRS